MMKKYFWSAACAGVLFLSCTSVEAILAPACAQSDYAVDFYTFHDQLAPYGAWVYSDRWGEVWMPGDVPDDFHPYGTGGHWGYTDEFGWTWVSDYEWGDIPFHYGRWVNDPYDGWLWIPGYVWSPGWVIWRSNGQYTGWMPMPPDAAFLGGNGPAYGFSFGYGGIGVSIDFNDTRNYYGYSQWYGRDYGENRFAANWVFVGTGHLADLDYRGYEAPPDNYSILIRNTTNITNYSVVNNYIVNKSVDVRVVERAGGHPVQKLTVADVIRNPHFITHADTGRAIQLRMRAQIPRGNGHAGSAPKPSPQIVQSLSHTVPMRNGNQPTHLFTQESVSRAPLANAPVTGATGTGATSRHPDESGTPPGAMTPGATPHNLESAHHIPAPSSTGEQGMPSGNLSGGGMGSPDYGTTPHNSEGTHHEPAPSSMGGQGMPPGVPSGTMGSSVSSSVHSEHAPPPPTSPAAKNTAPPAKPSGEQKSEKKPKPDEPQ
jgi:hypothetical protein